MFYFCMNLITCIMLLVYHKYTADNLIMHVWYVICMYNHDARMDYTACGKMHPLELHWVDFLPMRKANGCFSTNGHSAW